MVAPWDDPSHERHAMEAVFNTAPADGNPAFESDPRQRWSDERLEAANMAHEEADAEVAELDPPRSPREVDAAVAEATASFAACVWPRGDIGSRRRRSCDVDIPWRRVAATPRLRIVRGGRTREGSVTATYGSSSRFRRGCDVDNPSRRVAATPRVPRG